MMGFWLLGMVWMLPHSVIAQALQSPKRYALVVGVAEYPVSNKLPKLSDTEPDARGISDTLAQSGYQVTLLSQAASRKRPGGVQPQLCSDMSASGCIPLRSHSVTPERPARK